MDGPVIEPSVATRKAETREKVQQEQVQRPTRNCSEERQAKSGIL